MYSYYTNSSQWTLLLYMAAIHSLSALTSYTPFFDSGHLQYLV